MKIAAFRPFSLSDYPGKTATLVFTQGCNFRCPYCHNPSLTTMNSDTSVSIDFVMDFLSHRRGKLEGVVITGGEPTLQDELPEFLRRVKELGYRVKLDTNGSHPEIVEELLEEKLLDYIAMDIKGPPGSYERIVNRPVNMDVIRRTIDLVMGSGLEYEFRTTVVKSFLQPGDLAACGRLTAGARLYVLQTFIPRHAMAERLRSETPYTHEELSLMRKRLAGLVKTCLIR
jgi:pyruvate formate lyase activating enzyme